MPSNMKKREKYNGLGETNYAKDAHFQIQVDRKTIWYWNN